MSEKRANKPLCAVISGVFALLAIVGAVLYYLPSFAYFGDAALNKTFSEAVVRACVAGFLISLAVYGGETSLFGYKIKGGRKGLAIVSPCFIVAIVNFPFSALIGGGATITRGDLILLVVIDCVLIAVTEEVFFRGLLQNYFAERLKDRRYPLVLTVLVTNAVFALWHLVNLFSAGVGETLLQVVYTFLVGSMLSFMITESKNLWLCVITHAVFDVGGSISSVGVGNFQDTIFWVLTVSVGIIVGAYVVCFLFFRQKKQNETRDLRFTVQSGGKK